MIDFHKYCIRIEKNIEILNILGYNIESSEYNNHLLSLEKSLKSISSKEKINHNDIKEFENSLNGIFNFLKNNNDNKINFVYELIKADALYIKSNYLKNIIFNIKNNINNYLREDVNHKELNFEHIETFKPQEFFKTFDKNGENENNKHSVIAFKLFEILTSLIEKYKKIEEKINIILKKI